MRRAMIGSPELAARLRQPSDHGAGPRRVMLASAVFFLCAVALTALTLARRSIAEYVASPLAEKLTGAERVTYYVFTRDEGPRFRVGPGDRSIKLLTHLVLPPGLPYDEHAEQVYGVELTLSDLDGEVLWVQEINVRTHQSKAGEARYGWEQENAFMLDDRRGLTDDRLTRVRLPEASEDRILSLRLLPREPAVNVSGLVRLYTRRPRRIDVRSFQGLALAPDTGRELIEHLTYRDWDQLSEAERRRKLRHVWVRLAAEGKPPIDYEVKSIYETGFRIPRREHSGERRLAVDPTRSLAINVLGPAEIGLELFAEPRRARLLEISAVGLDGVVERWARSQTRVRNLSVPAGLHTLVFESPRRLEMSLEVLEADPPRVRLREAERPLRVNEEDKEVLEPDLRRIPLVRLGPFWPDPPRYAIPPAGDVLARTLRFDIRVVARFAGWWPEEAFAPSVELCFIDERGEELSCSPWTASERAVASSFEGLREGAERGSAAKWYVVSEPQTIRVVAPEGTAEVVVRPVEGRAPQRLLIRGYGYWPRTETEIGSPFRIYQGEEVRWRYPPLDSRTWFPIRPLNFDELEEMDAIANLHAQVRLEPRADGAAGAEALVDPDQDDLQVAERSGPDGWDPGPWVTLEPRGVHRRRSILERLDGSASRWLSSRWSPSLWTELKGGSSVVDLGAAGPNPPELHWQVAPELLGREIGLRIDGELHQTRITSTRGAWALPLERGRHRVELALEAPKGQFDVWIDRPVVQGRSAVSRHRVVHELTNRLSFPLDKPDAEALILNVVVYLPRGLEQAELALSLDGGRPQRITGVVLEHVSVPQRSFTIDKLAAFDEHGEHVERRERVHFVDLEGRQGGALDLVTLQLTVGADVVRGPHELTVELLEGKRAWVRVFHRGVADRSRPATSWTEVDAP